MKLRYSQRGDTLVAEVTGERSNVKLMLKGTWAGITLFELADNQANRNVVAHGLRVLRQIIRTRLNGSP